MVLLSRVPLGCRDNLCGNLVLDAGLLQLCCLLLQEDFKSVADGLSASFSAVQWTSGLLEQNSETWTGGVMASILKLLHELLNLATLHPHTKSIGKHKGIHSLRFPPIIYD